MKASNSIFLGRYSPEKSRGVSAAISLINSRNSRIGRVLDVAIGSAINLSGVATTATPAEPANLWPEIEIILRARSSLDIDIALDVQLRIVSLALLTELETVTVSRQGVIYLVNDGGSTATVINALRSQKSSGTYMMRWAKQTRDYRKPV